MITESRKLFFLLIALLLFILPSSALEDLTTYTENDGGSNIVVNNATAVTFTNAFSVSAEFLERGYATTDTFTLDFEAKIDSDNDLGKYTLGIGVSDELSRYIPKAQGNGLYLVYHDSDAFYLIQDKNGVLTVSAAMPITLGTKYYMRLNRAGTTVTGYIYSDEARTVLVDSETFSTTVSNTTVIQAIVGYNTCCTYSLASGILTNYTYTFPAPELNLTYPEYGSTIPVSYPPITNSINFTWNSTRTDLSYLLSVARDPNFNLLVHEDVTSTNYSVVALDSNQQYYWKVRYYNISDNSIGNSSGISTFTLTASAGNETISSIQGIVYELLVDGSTSPLSDSIVYISNASWSSQMVTGSNGYYLFSQLASGTVYYIKATKQDYEDSVVENVNATVNFTTRNIPLKKCISGFNCFYNQHYVRFIVQNMWWTKYQYVTVTVYKGDSLTPDTSAVQRCGSPCLTDTQGAASILFTKDQTYRLTFINSSLGISESITLVPVDPQYVIIVSTSVNQSSWYPTGKSKLQNINISVNTTINSTGYGIIGILYNDAMAQTSNLHIYINQTNSSDPANQTTIAHYSGGAASWYSISYPVASPGSKSFIINVYADHTTFGAISQSYGVKFKGLPSTALDFIPSWFKAIIAAGILFFVAAFAGFTSKNQIAGIVCVLGWIFYGFGWFDAISSSYSAGLPVGLTIATVIAVIANMNARAERDNL